MSKTEADVVEHKEKVDFFVQTSLPPTRGIFYDGQVFDAKDGWLGRGWKAVV